MGIEFHCSHCTKLIRAPSAHGGKRGKCPYCKQSVYVPSAPEELEEIPLAPVDEGDEQRRQRLAEEARQLQAALNREKAEPQETRRPGDAAAATGGAETAMPLPREAIDEAEIETMAADYVRAMQASQLEEADGVAERLRTHAASARQHVQRMMLDELPPPGLEGIPPALFKGFLRTLLERL
ncbi:MAG: hypothetical protein GY778_21015 [bacterium]|nr:hypothetical protein [bacterium]